MILIFVRMRVFARPRPTKMTIQHSSPRHADRRPAPSLLSRLVRHAIGGAVASAPILMFPFAAQAQQAGAAAVDRVVITGARLADDPAYAGGQIGRSGGLGVLGEADIMKTPFSTTNYTSQILEDQQVRTLADVVVNEASVRVMTSTGGFSEDFQIRGFNVTSGDVGLNGLYGLSSSNRMPAAIMERVEVLKGPGTLMYGISPNGSIGGNINIATKRAGDTPLTRVSATYESKSILGAHLDVGRRFGENNAWGVRVNGVVRHGDTNIDDGTQDFGLAAIAVDYRSSKLRWTLDSYGQQEKTDNFRAQNSFRPDISAIPAPPSGHRAAYSGADLEFRDATAATRLEYDVSDQLMVYAAGGYHYGASEQDFPSARALNAVDTLGNFRLTNAWYDAYSRSKTGEAGARLKLATFGVQHVITASVSTLDSEAGSFFLSAPASTSQLSNIYNPVRITPMTGNRLAPTKTSETELSSVSLTDTLSFADGRVLFTGGVRKQKVEADNLNPSGAVTSGYSESAVSPLAGIVVIPVENLSLYANFTSGLTRGSTAPATAANAGEVFAPFKSKQYEIGAKADIGHARGRVLLGAAVFQIDRPNAITDPITTVYSLDGIQRNRGLELSATGEAAPGLRLMTSATFYDAKQHQTAGGVNEGRKATGVPRNTFNAGVDWDLPWVSGLSLSGRAIHTAEMEQNVTNTVSFSSWNRFDIGTRYRTELMGKAVVLRANIENVANKRYWLSSSTLATVGTAAAPRTVVMSAQVDF